MSWPWSELGLDGPASLDEVRHAYAQRLKETHPEEDPEGFQRLHQAYQQARQAARRAGGTRTPPAPPPPEQTPAAQTPPEPEPEAEPEPQQEPAPEETQEPEEAPPPQEEQWDFQRLFAEEERRQAEAARQQGGSTQNQRIDRAIQLVALLLQEERPRTDWERFFRSQLFFLVKSEPRFVDALAQGLRTWPPHNPKIRSDVLVIYGLTGKYAPPLYRNLYQALTGREFSDEKRQRREARRKSPLRKLLILAAVLIALAVIVQLSSQRPYRQQARDICQYIQEDFGFTAQSLYDGRAEDAERYYLPAQQLYFLAWPDGERDLSQGQLGYGTNLANALLTQKLENFADQWSDVCTLEQLDEGGMADVYGGTPGGYALTLSLWDGENCVAALGELMDQLAQEDWYSQLAPAFTLYLNIWDLTFFTYTAPGDPFDGNEVYDYYRDTLKWELVAYLVEESGLTTMDFGEDVYWLEKRDTVTLQGDTYILVGGVDAESGETVRLYLYNPQYLISTPADTFDPDMGQLEYFHFTGGPKIEAPSRELPWPYLGIVRHESNPSR